MKDGAHWALNARAYLSEAIRDEFIQLAEIVSLDIQIFVLILLIRLYVILIILDLYGYNLRVLVIISELAN